MSTDMKFWHADGEEFDDLDLNPTVELQIYNVSPTTTSLKYTDTQDRTWNKIEKIDLEVPATAGALALHFLWRVAGKFEVINVTSTPSPSRTAGANFTEYALSAPPVIHAIFEYEFTGGVPGFPLKVRVKRKA